MLSIDSISLATKITGKICSKLDEGKRPQSEIRKRIIIRIASALEANVLTLGDKVLLDLELRSLKSASEIVRQVFEEETGFSPKGEILPEVFELRSHLPLVAASYGKRIPNRETPPKEAIAIYDELIENPEISRKYEREAIITPEYPFDETDPKYIVAVESGRDRDKFRKLDDAIEHSKFLAVLEKVWQNSAKSKEEFRIIIKSHFITMLAREETGVYVDPSLVLHLVRRIIEAGFPKVAVAEGRNSFGKWLGFRGVCRVAARAGYIDEDDIQLDGPAPRKITGYVLANNVLHPFEIIDLGLNTEDYNFGGEVLSVHPVNKDWAEADFRISFAKLKTHHYTRYALHLVNLSLALPLEDKILSYPRMEDCAKAVVDMLKVFPVHFCFTDGITASDGSMGYIRRAVPRTPGLIIAGQDILASECLGAQLMGLDPFESVFMRISAEKLGGMVPYKVVGHAPLIQPWRNIRGGIVTTVVKIAEKLPSITNWWAPLFIENFDDFFPLKGGEKQIKRLNILRWLTGTNILLFFLTTDRIWRKALRFLTDLRIRRMGEKLKLTNLDPSFAEYMRYLRKDDLRRLRQIVYSHGEQILDGKVDVRRYGHIVRVGEANYPFLGNDSLGAISAGEILKGIKQRKWSPAELIPELEGWMVIKHSFGTRL